MEIKHLFFKQVRRLLGDECIPEILEWGVTAIVYALNHYLMEHGLETRYELKKTTADDASFKEQESDSLEIKINRKDCATLYASAIRCIHRDGSYIKVELYHSAEYPLEKVVLRGECNPEKQLFVDTLGNIAKRYTGDTLIRVNRKLILNIHEVHHRTNEVLILHNGESVTIGKEYAEACKAKFMTKSQLKKLSPFS